MSRRWPQILVLGLSIGLAVGCAAPIPAGSPATGTLVAAPPASNPAVVQPSPTVTAIAASEPPSPTPAALAPTASLAPSPTPSALPTPATPAPATPTPATPRSAPTASPSGVWLGPELVATDADAFGFVDIAIAADDDGAAHIITGGREGLRHHTNSTGEWLGRTITTAPADGYDGEPSIAQADDGRLIVAFTRFESWDCFEVGCAPGDPVGIELLIREPEGWAEPEPVVEGIGPSVAVSDEQFLVAYQADGLRLARSAGGEWTSTELAKNGETPRLLLTRDGSPVIAFVEYEQETDDFTFRHATDAAGSGQFEIVPGPTLEFFSWPVFAIDIDSADRLHLVGANDYRTFGGGWSEPVPIFDSEGDGGLAGGVAVGPDDRVHVVSYAPTCAPMLYAVGGAGAFDTFEFTSHEVGCIEDGPQVTQAIATDAAGRPHVVFTALGEDGGVELWYARGD